jgi:hypothetical protein
MGEHTMLPGHLALTVAALFTGAAFYINFAEQPARLGLDDRSLLAEWKPSYARGFAMQAPLAMLGFLLGAATWVIADDWLWLLGGLALLANWPYTLLVLMPINNRLKDTAPDAAGPETRALVERWGRLHGVRTTLGALSTLIFLWALN